MACPSNRWFLVHTVIKTASDIIEIFTEHRFCCPRFFVCSQSPSMRSLGHLEHTRQLHQLYSQRFTSRKSQNSHNTTKQLCYVDMLGACPIIGRNKALKIEVREDNPKARYCGSCLHFFSLSHSSSCPFSLSLSLPHPDPPFCVCVHAYM